MGRNGDDKDAFTVPDKLNGKVVGIGQTVDNECNVRCIRRIALTLPVELPRMHDLSDYRRGHDTHCPHALRCVSPACSAACVFIACACLRIHSLCMSCIVNTAPRLSPVSRSTASLDLDLASARFFPRPLCSADLLTPLHRIAALLLGSFAAVASAPTSRIAS